MEAAQVRHDVTLQVTELTERVDAEWKQLRYVTTSRCHIVHVAMSSCSRDLHLNEGVGFRVEMASSFKKRGDDDVGEKPRDDFDAMVRQLQFEIKGNVSACTRVSNRSISGLK